MNKTKCWMIFIFIILPIFYLVLSYFIDLSFFVLFSVYGVIVLINLLFQMFYAYINNKVSQYRTNKNYKPKVSVVIPTYNEDYNELKDCLFSVGNQNYDNFDIYLIDDGTDNNVSEKVFNEFKEKFPKIKKCYYKLPVHCGKRFAQKYAFDKTDSEIVVTVDSDTVLFPDTISEMVKPFYDQKVGAVTGNVRAKNKYQNILTKLIDIRYWMAFNQERASQSLFGTTMCVSGVLGAFRTSIIKKVKERYVTQRFMGKLCHFGDDRHLSNLALNEGYKIYYLPRAKALTTVPVKTGKWLKQQLRWNKSFYREILWNIPSIRKHSIYMGMELFLQAVLPFFLLLNLIICLIKGITIDVRYFLLYFTILVSIPLVRIYYPLYKTKDITFVMFPIYAIIHLLLLIPVRIIALATLGFNGWGTR